jgi:hypothetical protein
MNQDVIFEEKEEPCFHDECKGQSYDKIFDRSPQVRNPLHFI